MTQLSHSYTVRLGLSTLSETVDYHHQTREDRVSFTNLKSEVSGFCFLFLSSIWAEIK